MPNAASIPSGNTPPTAMPAVYPLDDFYAQSGMALPAVQAIGGGEVPEPERSLLVHQSDMTSTLAAFHRSGIHLEVLRRELRGEYYLREVVLLLDTDKRAVEFGAIKIQLSLLPATARRQILDEKLPLGQILKECSVRYTSRPKVFLKVVSDDFINKALRLTSPQTLYGRRNTLSDPQQRPLAEIVEILPPHAPR